MSGEKPPTTLRDELTNCCLEKMDPKRVDVSPIKKKVGFFPVSHVIVYHFGYLPLGNFFPTKRLVLQKRVEMIWSIRRPPCMEVCDRWAGVAFEVSWKIGSFLRGFAKMYMPPNTVHITKKIGRWKFPKILHPKKTLWYWGSDLEPGFMYFPKWGAIWKPRILKITGPLHPNDFLYPDVWIDHQLKGLLSQWPTFFSTFGDSIFSRENKVQTFFFRVHWLSEKDFTQIILNLQMPLAIFGHFGGRRSVYLLASTSSLYVYICIYVQIFMYR